MKIFTILSFLACFVVRTSIAQSTFSDSLGDQIRHIFANVDKNAVSSGYLEEYKADFLPFSPFNGVLTDSNYADESTLRLLYGSLLTSKINTSAAHYSATGEAFRPAMDLKRRPGCIITPSCISGGTLESARRFNKRKLKKSEICRKPMR